MSQPATVYFSKTVTPEALKRMYQVLDRPLKGKVAVKVHSGEPGGRHFIQPEFMRGVVDLLSGTIVECNTAYEGKRYRTKDHLKALERHGFTRIAPVDIMDADGEIELPVAGGKHLKTNRVGAHLENYDSILILSHFKGHIMGGFGGAVKNMSIGIASSEGKKWIHGGGDPEVLWDCEQDIFLETMAEAAWSVAKFFGKNIAYINVMKDLSVDCDCDSHPAPPKWPISASSLRSIRSRWTRRASTWSIPAAIRGRRRSSLGWKIAMPFTHSRQPRRLDSEAGNINSRHYPKFLLLSKGRLYR